MADGSVTIEINGDASEVINSFKQVSSAAEALANSLKCITGSFETVSSASRGMSEGISGSLGDIDTYLDEIDDSLNELNNDPFSTAADGAQNLGNSLNDMDSYLDDLESSFDELRNDPFSTNSDGADRLREDLDRLSDSADDAEEDLDRLGDAADDAGDQMDEAGGSASKFSEIFKGTFMGNLAAKGVELAVEAVKKLGEAMIDVGKQAVEAYASYEQNVGGIDTLFKEASGTMQQYAANAYKTAGLSANQYMETATSFAASLISGLGGDVNKAAEVANRAITDMSDNANKMGTDMQSIQDAYQGFAKQNYTMLDNLKLGYGGTQSEMIRLINDSGVLGKKISSLDNVSFATMIEAIHEVQNNLGITGTTAKEAATTIEGSVNSMKGAWENWLVGLASPDADLGALTQNLVQSVVTVVQNVGPTIGRILSNLGNLILDGLSNLFPDVAGWISGPIEGVKSAFSTLGEAIGKVFTPERTAVISEFFQKFTEIAATVAITALSAALEFLANVITAVVTVIGALITFFSTTLPNAIQTVITWFQNLPDAIFNALTSAGTAIRNWGTSAKEALVNAVTNAINAVVTWFSGLASKITSALTAAGAAIRNWGNNVKQTMVNAVTNAVNAVVTWFQNLAGKITSALTTAGAAVRSWGSQMIANMRQAASNAVNAVITFFSSLPGKITSALAGALSALISWGSQMAAQARVKMVQVGNNIKSALASLPGQLVSIGANIVQGLINGITSRIGAAISAIKGFAGQIKGAFTSLLGIHSPSKVFYKYGVNIIQGLVNGLKENIKLARDAARNVANIVSKEVEKLNAEIEKIETAANERAAAKELAEYKKNLKEKNDELAKAEIKDREKIQADIDKLNEDWNEKQLQKQEAAQKEALKSQADALNEIKNNYEKALNAVESSRDSLQGKLSDVDLFTEEDDFFQLTNLQKSIDAINKYGDTIQALKDRGIVDSLLDEVLGLDQEKAMKYANALLGMADDQYENYMALWQEKEAASKKVAQSIYQTEIDAIHDEYLDKLPDEFKPAGQEAMDAFGDGLAISGERAIAIAKSVSDSILAELDRINAADVVSSAVNAEVSGFSGRLTGTVNDKAAQAASLKTEDMTGLANAIVLASSAQGRSKEIVLKLNGKEVARGLIDDIRAVEDQSPRIVSD